MYARTSSWTGTPEALEKWAEQVAGVVAPMVAGLPGNAGAYFFVDREDGRAVTLTLWESEDTALARRTAGHNPPGARGLGRLPAKGYARGRKAVVEELVFPPPRDPRPRPSPAACVPPSYLVAKNGLAVAPA